MGAVLGSPVCCASYGSDDWLASWHCISPPGLFSLSFFTQRSSSISLRASYTQLTLRAISPHRTHQQQGRRGTPDAARLKSPLGPQSSPNSKVQPGELNLETRLWRATARLSMSMIKQTLRQMSHVSAHDARDLPNGYPSALWRQTTS